MNFLTFSNYAHQKILKIVVDMEKILGYLLIVGNEEWFFKA